MDYIQPTPRNRVLGLLADGLQGVNDFASAPGGYDNPPVRMLLGLLGVPDVAKTLDRMSYGESLTTGKGMTLKPREEVANALLAVAPLAPAAGRAANVTAKALAPKAAEMTEDYLLGTGLAVPMAIDPLAKKRLVSDLTRGVSSGTYRLGDVTSGQLKRYAKASGEQPLSNDVVMGSAFNHLMKRKDVDNFTPEEIGTFMEQSMRPNSFIDYDPAKSGQYPSLLNTDMVDKVTGRKYDARLPLRVNEQGLLEVVSVYPDGLSKRKGPAK
jgi:hypothetical protein